ncbi:MAG: ABC transporter ATP-binding protein [Pirellulaceae bacterium]
MIELRNVTIRAGNYRLEKISFRVEAGQYAAIMGVTGIGKTTILEAVCGLRRIESGNIFIGDIDVTHWSPADRKLGYVPQDLALFPTMTVREHLEFAMRLRRTVSQQREARVAELSKLLNITPLLNRKVAKLSGGEAQRVALGRALSFQPSALLLDEPLSALDSATRTAMQELLRDVNRQMGVAVLHITHNEQEAAAVSDVCIRLTRVQPHEALQITAAPTRRGYGEPG